jgi:hypothetical protein
MTTMTRSQIETLDPGTATLTLSLDVGLYPRDVLYAAAYVFLDQVVDANQRIIEDVVAVAIAGAAGDAPGDAPLEGVPLIDPSDPEDGFVADPLGIARPWEPEKQGGE